MLISLHLNALIEMKDLIQETLTLLPIANAILDRLVHHSHIINITGKSYRTKNLIVDSENDNCN